MSALNNFVDELNLFAEKYMKNTQPVKEALTNAVKFHYSSNVDILSLVNQLPDSESLIEAHNDLILYSRSNMGAYGIAVYMDRYLNTSYKNTKFAKDTLWYDFLLKLKY